MKAKVFSSGEKIRHHTQYMQCSAVKIVNGHWEGLPAVTIGNLEQYFLAASKHSGANAGWTDMGGGALSEIEMMDGEMDQRASCINEDSLLLGSSIWPANMRYVPWRTNKQHTPNAGHTNVLFKFNFPSQILPYRLITSTRTVACHKSQTSSPPSMLFHMECGQGGLPKIKMNMRGPGRWQSC